MFDIVCKERKGFKEQAAGIRIKRDKTWTRNKELKESRIKGAMLQFHMRSILYMSGGVWLKL